MIIYWIHLPNHTDPYTQGYVGITSDFDRRMGQYRRSINTKSKQKYHITQVIKKYGWDNLEKEVILLCDTLEEALSIESSYRPNANIGWNTLAGGGVNQNLKHSSETKAKISTSMLGNSNTSGFSNNIVVCPFCNKQGQEAAMRRWHFDNCKCR